jgi:hypothetical protein
MGEIATKARLGKLDVATEVVENFVPYLIPERFESLSITAAHAIPAGLHPDHTKILSIGC